jgi:hypothetical protein
MSEIFSTKKLIKEAQWLSIEKAPKDGTPILVKLRAWVNADLPINIVCYKSAHDRSYPDRIWYAEGNGDDYYTVAYSSEQILGFMRLDLLDTISTIARIATEGLELCAFHGDHVTSEALAKESLIEIEAFSNNYIKGVL